MDLRVLSFRTLVVVTERVGLVLLSTGFLALLSLCVYRLFFHPLSRYPGPFLARFTRLYAAYHAWKGDIHLDMFRCHGRYGDYIRYAPDRVVINTADGLQDIHGPRANTTKSDGYKVLSHNVPNMLTMKDLTVEDKGEHSRRKHLISPKLSPFSLRHLEPMLTSRIDRLQHVIGSHCTMSDKWSDPIDMADEFNRLAFDTMTAVIFGSDYNTLDHPQYRYAIDAIEESNVRLSVLFQAPELALWGLDRKVFSRSAAATRRFVQFIKGLLKDRQHSGYERRDLFSSLEKAPSGEGLTPAELNAETAALIVAGFDTTSTTMAAVMYYLSESEDCYRRVMDEVRTKFSTLDQIHVGPDLNSCVYLQACVSEALRMSPPGGSALWREIGPGGALIEGEFIPTGYEVGVGIYSLHHNKRYHPSPFAYNPGRWLSSGYPGKEAYMPFSIGRRSCVGKPLAMAQIMLTCARLFWEFDFRRADADCSSGSEYILKDHINGQKRGPVLCFRHRQH